MIVGTALAILLLTWQFGIAEGFKRGTAHAAELAQAAETERGRRSDRITADLAQAATDQLAEQNDLIRTLERRIRALRNDPGHARVCIEHFRADRLRELRAPAADPRAPDLRVTMPAEPGAWSGA